MSAGALSSQEILVPCRRSCIFLATMARVFCPGLSVASVALRCMMPQLREGSRAPSMSSSMSSSQPCSWRGKVPAVEQKKSSGGFKCTETTLGSGKSLSRNLLEVGNGFRGDVAVCLRCSCTLPKLVLGRFQRVDMKLDGFRCPCVPAPGLCDDVWFSWGPVSCLWEVPACATR